MTTGLPVISTNHTSAPDLITDGVDGFIIPIRESNELVEKLLYLIENPIERLEMGNAAFMKAKLFTWERFKMQLISRLND
jgi:glycosyltransferase involved in cell wall biosynthesis